jgi:hypothetical protein
MAYPTLRGALYDRDGPGHTLAARATVKVTVIGKHPRTTKLVDKPLLRGRERLGLKRTIVCDDLMPAAVVHPGDTCADGNGDVLWDKLQDLDSDGGRSARLPWRRRPA